MGPLKQMHGMLALRPDEMAKVQDGLKQSCKIAIEGIQDMFHEETQQTIQQVQSVIQFSADQMLVSIKSNCQQGPSKYYVTHPSCHIP
jgi:hypothetical protein